MNNHQLVGVTSRSFSSHPILRSELLAKYPNVRFNETGQHLSGDSLLAHLRGCSKAITGLEKIDERLLIQLPELRVIGKYGVGLDMLDLRAMQSHSLKLGWTPGVNKRAVAELALCFALSLVRRVPEGIQNVKTNNWRQIIGGELGGKTVGVIGIGNIGKELVRMLKPFHCSILAHDIAEYPEFYGENSEVTPCSLRTLLQNSDIISLHVPLTNLTKLMLDGDNLALLRPHAILINTARGGLVCEHSLYALLQQKKIGAAAFDVFEKEPPIDSPLLRLENFVSTPHIGGSSEEAILAMGRAAIRGLDEYHDPELFVCD